jgi:hypothetical protein
MARSLTASSFHVAAHYSFGMLHGLVILQIAIQFLLSVFYWWFSHILEDES